MEQETLYQQVNGEDGLRALVNRFYQLMDELPEAKGVRNLHPPDITGSAEKLFKFLSGFLGGPQLYTSEYGHPRLRVRHLPFKIGKQEQDEWLLCMEQALSETVSDQTLHNTLLSYFRRTADHMRNQSE
jgi:hemoglobin